MKGFRWSWLLALSSLPLAAQAPQVLSDPIGFGYSVPADWHLVIPQAADITEPPNSAQEVKKGMACAEVPLTARHGNPVSAIVIITLPFMCFGQTMAEEDLDGFGTGVTEGLKTTFDFLNPISATYKLAGHKLWIERVKAVPKGKTAPVETVETTCTILSKGAVCWMVEAADAASLEAFEHETVTLEGSAPTGLVPADVFVESPAPKAVPR